MSIGAQVRKKRNMLNFNQRQLAKKIGIRQSELSRIESDKVKGLPETLLRKIAEALGENVSYFFEERTTNNLWSLGQTENVPTIKVKLEITPETEKTIIRLIREFKKG